MRYIRTTHDSEGNCLFDDILDKMEICGVGVHGFSNQTPMTFDEYYDFNKEYFEEWHPEDHLPTPSREELMHDVSRMLEYGMVSEVK